MLLSCVMCFKIKNMIQYYGLTQQDKQNQGNYTISTQYTVVLYSVQYKFVIWCNFVHREKDIFPCDFVNTK